MRRDEDESQFSIYCRAQSGGGPWRGVLASGIVWDWEEERASFAHKCKRKEQGQVDRRGWSTLYAMMVLYVESTGN